MLCSFQSCYSPETHNYQCASSVCKREQRANSSHMEMTKNETHLLNLEVPKNFTYVIGGSCSQDSSSSRAYTNNRYCLFARKLVLPSLPGQLSLTYIWASFVRLLLQPAERRNFHFQELILIEGFLSKKRFVGASNLICFTNWCAFYSPFLAFLPSGALSFLWSYESLCLFLFSFHLC